MYRTLLALTVLLSAAPAAAQRADTLPLPRFTVTPYLGGRIPFSTEQTFLNRDSTAGFFFDEERGGGALTGLDAELRVRGPFSAVAGVAYSNAGDIVFTVVELGEDTSSAQRLVRTGSTYLLSKLGVAYRLPLPDPETRRFRSVASLVAAPALVRETPAGQSAINHPAVNLGFKALLPLGNSRIAFQMAFEDYVTFWNTREYERRERARIDEPGLIVDFGSPRGNLLMFHGGLTFLVGSRTPALVRTYTPTPAPAPEATAPGMIPVRICVVEGGELREVDAMVSSATGDTTVNRRRFGDVYPETMGYAATRDFYIRSEAITVNRTRYVRFGLTRIIPASALTRAGEYQGVPFFRERNVTDAPDVLYLPVRSGCEFQTYQREQAVQGVRG